MSQESYTTRGIVHAIPEAKEGGKYPIAFLVLEVDGYKEKKEYPCFEFFGKNADRVDPFKVGDECEITWNLAGSEYKGRWYPKLSAWKALKLNGDGHQGDYSRPPEREPRERPPLDQERRATRREAPAPTSRDEDDINW